MITTCADDIRKRKIASTVLSDFAAHVLVDYSRTYVSGVLFRLGCCPYDFEPGTGQAYVNEGRLNSFLVVEGARINFIKYIRTHR